jgi:hypothetical protein
MCCDTPTVSMTAEKTHPGRETSSGKGPVHTGFLPPKDWASEDIATFQNLSPTKPEFRGRVEMFHSVRGIDPSS